MTVSIRFRLILLVLAVLLPGLLGAAWLINDTYDAERRANERTLRETARAISQVVDIELQRRATIARVLAQSSWLDEPAPVSSQHLANFEQLARRALAGVDGWIELRSADRVLMDTRGQEFSGRELPAHTLATEGRVDPKWPAPASPATPTHATLVQPVQREGRTRYELVITVLPVEMQRIVDSQAMAPGWVCTVMDDQGTVVAHSPASSGFLSRPNIADLRQRLQDSTEGLIHTASLDGHPTTGYFSRGPMGWSYAIGMPTEAFAGRLPGTVRRVALGSLLLLALSVGGALWLARRIVQPVSILKQAVAQLRNGQAVQVRATGLVECDEVASALAEAAQTLQRARTDLESQVAEAVQRTRLVEQRAAQGQRVAAVGRLTGGVAHDFNNLLGVISNSAHLMQRHPAAAELAAPLAATQRAVEMGSQLTQHLLRFAGRRPMRPQLLRVATALPDMQVLLQSVLGRRVSATVQVAPHTAPVHVDAAELELALINLALNASDAMPGGGEVRVRARNANEDDLAGSPSLAPGRYVLISVGDDGVGIEPAVAAHVFEPFYTTKGLGQGSGLGLSQVHGFCTQAGGAARLESTPGLGTTVLMLLRAAGLAPTLPDDERQCPANAAVLQAHAINGARVLLVEDDEAVADTTTALLTAHGARVARAADAMQAMRSIDNGERFDVVLTDVMMPGTMDGLALARRMRSLKPSLPVVLISGFSQAAAGAEAEFRVLRKPCPEHELLAVLHSAITQGG